jgi:hypothetical protein
MKGGLPTLGERLEVIQRWREWTEDFQRVEREHRFMVTVHWVRRNGTFQVIGDSGRRYDVRRDGSVVDSTGRMRGSAYVQRLTNEAGALALVASLSGSTP